MSWHQLLRSRCPPGPDVDEVQHAVAATVLWHLRVLGGWVPHGDARILRVGRRLRSGQHRRPCPHVVGRPSPKPFLARRAGDDVGSPYLQRDVPGSRAGPRPVCGRPAGGTPAAPHLSMRVSWAARVASQLPGIKHWAGCALLIARGRLSWPAPADGCGHPNGRRTGRSGRTPGPFGTGCRRARHSAVVGVGGRRRPGRLTCGAPRLTWWARVERDGFAPPCISRWRRQFGRRLGRRDGRRRLAVRRARGRRSRRIERSPRLEAFDAVA